MVYKFALILGFRKFPKRMNVVVDFSRTTKSINYECKGIQYNTLGFNIYCLASTSLKPNETTC